MLTVLAAALATQLSLLPTDEPARWTLIDQTLEGLGSDLAPEPFATKTILLQAIASVGGAVLLGVGGAYGGAAFGNAVGGAGGYADLFYGVLGGGIGMPLGFILGVWGTGATLGHSGSLAATVGTSIIGFSVNLLAGLAHPALLIASVPLTVAGVIAVYHLTDKASRSVAAARPEEGSVIAAAPSAASLAWVTF